MSSQPSSKRQRTDDDDNDDNLKVLSKTKSARFEIPNFNELSQEHDYVFQTPPQEIHGSSWYIKLYPNGHSSNVGGGVCCYLHSMDSSRSNQIMTDFKISLSPSVTRKDSRRVFDGCQTNSWGWSDMATRADVAEKCLNAEGSLIVELDLRVCRERTTWYPKPDLETNLISKKLFESEAGADIWFTIGEEKKRFHGHKAILFHRAPLLNDLLKDVPNGQDFELSDVTSRVFQPLLEYVYLGTLPELDADNDEGLAKQLLLAADRFGLHHIKLHVESEIISKFLETHNAGEWILFADSHTCPLLKEACVDLYTSNVAEVKKTQGWKAVKESPDLLEEVLELSVVAGKRVQTKDSKDYDTMSVRSLRENLESLDLDLDGSRQMLIQRLKHHRNQSQEETEGEEGAEEGGD